MVAVVKKKKKARRKAKKSRKPSAKSKRSPDSRLDKTLRLIPGYDPFATAGDCHLDDEAAHHAIGFFEDMLTHVKGDLAGTPLRLERWQQAIVGNLFGWKRPDGTRRYRSALVYIPRKNGKTTIAAGIGNYMLLADGEAEAEIYAAASEKAQASITWNIARRQVQNNDELNSHCKIYGAHKSITMPTVDSFFKPISRDSNTKHGYDAHCVLNDELHAHRDRELSDVLETSMAARSQPLTFKTTTADYDRPSMCNEEHKYACDIRDGIFNEPSYLPVVYDTDRDADWTSESVWRAANPNYGISVLKDYFREKFKKAQEMPSFENTFKRLHLNLKTEQSQRWLKLAAWDRCGAKFNPKDLVGKYCIGGVDLGATADLTTLCLIFKRPEGGFIALWWFWIGRDSALERQRRDRVPYMTWADQGLIELTPGSETDYEFIRERINQIGEQYQIGELAADRLFQGAQLCQNLVDDGFEMVPFGQGMLSMAAPTQEFERLVNRGEFWHGNNPVVRWMASNVTVFRDASDNMKPDKKKSADKIDGIVAAIMALGRTMEDGGPKESVYKKRGFRQL